MKDLYLASYKSSLWGGGGGRESGEGLWKENTLQEKPCIYFWGEAGGNGGKGVFQCMRWKEFDYFMHIVFAGEVETLKCDFIEMCKGCLRLFKKDCVMRWILPFFTSKALSFHEFQQSPIHLVRQSLLERKK